MRSGRSDSGLISSLQAVLEKLLRQGMDQSFLRGTFIFKRGRIGSVQVAISGGRRFVVAVMSSALFYDNW